MNHHLLARSAGLALALALCAGTAAAGADADTLCAGSSSACLEQMSALLGSRGATTGQPPRAQRAARAERPRPQAAKPRLNLDQRLSAPDDSEDRGG